MPENSPQRAEALDHLIHSFKDTARSTMTVQIPRLLVSDLTGAIYIVTKWREGNCGSVIADQKFIVTAEFDAIAAERAHARDLGSNQEEPTDA